MVRFSIFFILTCLFCSCSNKYSIDGKVSAGNFDGSMIYLYQMSEDLICVDSAEIIHGTFKMKGDVDSVMMLMMFMDKATVCPLVLEDGNISVDISDAGVKIKGTDLNDRLMDFTNKKKTIEEKLRSLDSELMRSVMNGENYDVKKLEIEKTADLINKEYCDFVSGFIRDNYDNVLSSGLYALICYTTPLDYLPELFLNIYDDGPDSFKKNALVSKYARMLKDIKR